VLLRRDTHHCCTAPQIDMYSYMHYAAEKKPVHTVVIPGNCAGKK
jgi:hypothetical protein